MEERMIIRSAVLETVCGITSTLPDNREPEFAFAGRSNVGKSTLLNTLVERKALARTSQTPGKTQTINYYKVNDAFYLVDLPGYGYAKVSGATREKWGKMIEKYLKRSKTLRAIFLLIDMRHPPTADDRAMYAWITANGFTPYVILTKADKLSRNEQAKMKAVIRKDLGLSDTDTMIPFSGETKLGRDEIRSILMSLLTTET